MLSCMLDGEKEKRREGGKVRGDGDVTVEMEGRGAPAVKKIIKGKEYTTKYTVKARVQ